MKFENLSYIKGKLKNSIIPNFSNGFEGLNYPIIVRSNFFDEDGEKTNAGKYESFIFWEKSNFDLNENYFVQEYISDADWYGVVFTCDLKNGSPYYFINMDRKQGTVTSGEDCEFKYVILKNHKTKNSIVKKIIKSCKEIECLFGKGNLDIEFCIRGDDIFIFQVREMPVKALDFDLKPYLKKIKILSSYSTMSDWNPAEMIGVYPDKLAINLYKKIITNRAWSKRRAEYGYKRVDKKLMIDFYGRPYIDVLKSFESLIPSDLSDSIVEKLLNYYKNELLKKPELHDKIEFDIIQSCYAPDFKLGENFSDEEIALVKKSLLNLTNNIIMQKFYEKEACILKNPKSSLNSIAESFAGVARLAFIATKLLRTIYDIEDQELFISSLKTVTKKISKSFFCYSKKSFLEKYGHLRPGTYDKKCLNYSNGYDFYFKNSKNCISIIKKHKLPNVNLKLKNIGYKFNSFRLESFIRNSIYLREYGKFILSKKINSILESREEQGKNFIGGLINLPEVINNKKDCYEYMIKTVSPNFIGKGVVFGKMVFLEKADPGYDWIFTQKINGLITKYGGSNSHMSLRCAELNIPAIIGCGEEFFKKWSQFESLEIDFDSKKVSGR